MNRQMPNFLIVGAMRSGTTSAFRYLGGHPDIYFPSQKEPNYLAFTNARPVQTGPGDRERAAGFVTTREAYLQLFDEGKHHAVRAEASTTYLYLPSAMTGIQRICPEALCLVMLRHPVDRAYSAYQYLRGQGRETAATFDEALEREPERVASGWAPIWHYRSASLYAAQIERLQRTVGAERVVICQYDDLVAKGPEALAPVVQQLGLPPLPAGVPETVHNKSGVPRHRVLGAVIAGSPAKRRLKNSLPRPMRMGVERALRGLDRWRSDNIEQPPSLSSTRRDELTAEFAEDVRRTSELTSLDLSSWLAAKDG